MSKRIPEPDPASPPSAQARPTGDADPTPPPHRAHVLDEPGFDDADPHPSSQSRDDADARSHPPAEEPAGEAVRAAATNPVDPADAVGPAEAPDAEGTPDPADGSGNPAASAVVTDRLGVPSSAGATDPLGEPPSAEVAASAGTAVTEPDDVLDATSPYDAVDPGNPEGAARMFGPGVDAQVAAYVRTRTPELRDRLVTELRPLVSRIASRLAMRLPRHVDRADLVSAGMLGLLEALDRFDPTRGPFGAFASVRVRGAMLDELRVLGALPRSYWAKRREVDRVASTLGNSLGRQPVPGEVASVTGLPVAEVAALSATRESWLCSLDEGAVEQAAGYDGSTVRDPEQAAVEADVQVRLHLAVDRLPDRPYRIITWYYRDGLTFKQIARRLGVTESRVAQLHAQTLRRLRGRLRRW